MDGGGGYRGLREVILRRRQAFERRATFLERELAPIFARRARRRIFGVTATVLALLSFASAGVGVLLNLPQHELTEAALLPLLAALPLGLVVSVVVGRLARKQLTPPRPRLPELRDRDEQSMFDLDVVEAELEAHPRANEGTIAWTLVGLGWTMPLLLHYVVAVAFNSTREFGSWIALSILISMQSHIALAVQNGRFARLLTTSEQPVNVHMQWLRTVGITTLVASVPWVFLAAVPTIITALTGLAFIPAMYIIVKKRLEGERAHAARIVAASYAELEFDADVAPAVLASPESSTEGLRVGAFAASRAEEEDSDRGGEDYREARQVSS